LTMFFFALRFVLLAMDLNRVGVQVQRTVLARSCGVYRGAVRSITS